MQAFGTPVRLQMVGVSMTHNDAKMTHNDAKTAVDLPQFTVVFVILENESRLIDAILNSKVERQ